MIEVLPGLADHVVVYRVAGTVTVEDYQKAVDALEAKLAKHERVAICADITEFSDITPDALAMRIRYGFSKIGELHRFARMAAISDKQWIEGMMNFARTWMPKLQARVFKPEEREAAMKWVAEGA